MTEVSSCAIARREEVARSSRSPAQGSSTWRSIATADLCPDASLPPTPEPTALSCVVHPPTSRAMPPHFSGGVSLQPHVALELATRCRLSMVFRSMVFVVCASDASVVRPAGLRSRTWAAAHLRPSRAVLTARKARLIAATSGDPLSRFAFQHWRRGQCRWWRWVAVALCDFGD